MTCVLGDWTYRTRECYPYDAPGDEEEELDGGARVNCQATSVSSIDDSDTSPVISHQQHTVDGELSVEEELISTSVPQELEDGGQPTINKLVQVNLGMEDDPRPTFVSATLTEEEREDYRSFLMEYRDCFAWSYKEMLGLDPRVATHKLAIDPHIRPIKQQPRRLHPELEDDVITEVNKLIVAGFLKETKYP